MKTPKKTIGLKKITSTSTYSFVNPLYYSKTFFGVKDGNDESVAAYVVELSALELTKIFKVFESLPNVHEWPISKLIQRELDKQRASLMSRDYLLGGGFLKYFPPLTAVLIPTNAQHLPSDDYPAVRADEGESAKKFWKVTLPPEYEDQLTQKIVAGGIYDLAASESPNGYIFWDETAVSAVIIDGQHRYKALMEAMTANKTFQGCRVVVNLIDIPQIVKRARKGPTSVARDLFVTINNTPVEVDEARLVLMDDRDAVATFTQVLVDDSETGENSPAVPAELVDWRCEQGKHNSDLALTGVLTLRGVIATAIFQNRTIDSVDERSSRTRVKKWLHNMKLWVNPDPTLKAKLGASETLERQFEIAQAEDDAAHEDEDVEQPFLFSYSAAASGLIKQEFKAKYLAVFREVYGGLVPYRRVLDVAKAAGAFEKGKEVHRYLRAFAGQRVELDKETETRKAVLSYEKDMQKVSRDSIPHTVMGQKAVFKALFDGYLSEVTPIAGVKLLKATKGFVKNFNETYELLNPSANFDECFNSTKFRLKKPVHSGTAGDLAREFWRGIILGDRGQIDYGERAVGILSQVFLDVLLWEEGDEFIFTDKEPIIERHIKVLQKFDSGISDSKARSICEAIVESKEETIEKLLKG